MNTAARIFVSALVGLGACSEPTDESPGAEVLELSSGTSFGMCAGYCMTELIVEPTMVRLIERSWPMAGLPERNRTLPLSSEDRARLVELAEVGDLLPLEGVHGCPDCADGGAEWIQVRTANETIRVTFEYGHVLPAIGELQAAIRAQRARFPR